MIFENISNLLHFTKIILRSHYEYLKLAEYTFQIYNN